ncbi:hypothetical protein KIN20_022806 [Parelaphostrongylus tenuis]|uniref:DNA helicase Pif1-like 2B domain-containing protein n=1 Tax=Parelaphostrongylus tenuis TaxID=148309 RepID=A0AAD5MQT0_PARTN|nr:hypothetical protein KIN20_022806 [Parelaphostrongylus tenuis]
MNNFSSIGIVPTRLCTHTADALAVNTRYLEELEGLCKHFQPLSNDILGFLIFLYDILGPSRTFDAEDSHLIPDSIQSAMAKRLVLRASTQMMLLKNIGLSRGLSNRSRRVVTRFSKERFSCSEIPV